MCGVGISYDVSRGAADRLGGESRRCVVVVAGRWHRSVGRTRPGRGDSSDLFPDELSDGLIDAGCSVVRIDPRDTGLSGPGGDSYRLMEMAGDIITVCDAIGLAAAHVVAVSMGGMIATDLAVRFPTRVTSLVLLAAMSPDPDAGIGEAFFDGIGADPVADTLAAMGTPTADDETWRRGRIDAAARRALLDPTSRGTDAAMRLGWRARTAEARAISPVAHAEAFANGITGSQLVVVDGMGHLPTRTVWIDLTRTIATFFATAAG